MSFFAAFERDPAALRRVLNGVREQAGADLLKAHRVAVQHGVRDVAADRIKALPFRVCFPAERVGQTAEQLADAENPGRGQKAVRRQDDTDLLP